MSRFETACDFQRPVDESAIEAALLRLARNITKYPVKIVFLSDAQALLINAKDARDARAAWAARAAWDVRDARDAWAARAAWAAWDARAACWELSTLSCEIAGAISLNKTDLYDQWLPAFEAFELGAWQIWWLPDAICVATLPTVKKIAPNRLHCTDGPAFSWCDIELYYLNGVLVEPWMVMTAQDKLDPKNILAVANVDQRRELIRRIGLDHLKDHLPHQILDTQGSYKLLAIDLSEEHRACRYLEMINPSNGAAHVEGVNNDCNTVQHAINWRAYGDINQTWDPSQLT